MASRMDWQRATQCDKARKPDSVPLTGITALPKRKRAVPFATVYARFAAAEREAGRKPLPPLQWIQALRAKHGVYG